MMPKSVTVVIVLTLFVYYNVSRLPAGTSGCPCARCHQARLWIERPADLWSAHCHSSPPKQPATQTWLVNSSILSKTACQGQNCKQSAARCNMSSVNSMAGMNSSHASCQSCMKNARSAATWQLAHYPIACQESRM